MGITGRVFQPSGARAGGGPTVTVGNGLVTKVGLSMGDGTVLAGVVDPAVVVGVWEFFIEPCLDVAMGVSMEAEAGLFMPAPGGI